MTILDTPRRLVNREAGQDWERSPLGLYVPPRVKRRYDWPVAVDLFAGAGGFGCGFHQAGFHVAAASDAWISAALTYMVNLARPGVRIHYDTPERETEFAAAVEAHLGLGGKGIARVDPSQITGRVSVAGSGWIAGQPPSHPGCEQYFLYDIRALTGEMILDALGLEPGDVAAVTGGPPCQGFSAAGKKNVMDPRNSLVFEFARLVVEIAPKTFVMENVPGILSMITPEGLPVVDAFCQMLDEGGYGEYDALRKSMMSTPDARAGIRKSDRERRGEDGKPVRSPRRKGKKARPRPAPADEQLDLFGGGA